jgi:hypothetical protein
MMNSGPRLLEPTLTLSGVLAADAAELVTTAAEARAAIVQIDFDIRNSLVNNER